VSFWNPNIRNTKLHTCSSVDMYFFSHDPASTKRAYMQDMNSAYGTISSYPEINKFNLFTVCSKIIMS
jgi:hypothetical protein